MESRAFIKRTRCVLWGVFFVLGSSGVASWYHTYHLQAASLSDTIPIMTSEKKLAVATLAGGCFWCVESDLEKLEGVHRVISGYTGGTSPNPTYEQVSSGHTTHLEAVQAYFSPETISYERLVDYFLRHIDPTDNQGQFVDRGAQYRPAIFYHDDDQKNTAQARLEVLGQQSSFSKPLAVELRSFTLFYPAEDYHQDYWRKNPLRYKYYRYRSGRDQFIEKHWDKDALDNTHTVAMSHADSAMSGAKGFVKPTRADLKASLSDLSFRVTQEDATEPPFDNALWDHHDTGIYVDVVSGEPLFASIHKFDSGTGWPSFYRPISSEAVREKKDFSLIWPRTEIRSVQADSHLGHVFDDGPQPTGLRYCINSAALRFIAYEEMKQLPQYQPFLALFNKEG